VIVIGIITKNLLTYNHKPSSSCCSCFVFNDYCFARIICIGSGANVYGTSYAYFRPG